LEGINGQGKLRLSTLSKERSEVGVADPNQPAEAMDDEITATDPTPDGLRIDLQELGDFRDRIKDRQTCNDGIGHLAFSLDPSLASRAA
jgi:hypothetical protein